MPVVDLAATQRHYIDHMAPVWRALDEDERGDVIVPENLRAYAASLGVVARRPAQMDVVLTAGFANVRGSSGWRKRVLMEHGVGQTYVGAHEAYAGGSGRHDKVDLYLCPNERVAALNAPYGQTAVVGSPYLEELQKIERDPQDLIVASFHWNCSVAPETQSARRVYHEPINRLTTYRWRVAHHAHPRDESLGEYHVDRFIQRFEDVVREASVYLCDNSSTMFYAAALGIPVVVLNAPWFRRDVQHGLRFWDHAGIGPNVWHEDDLPNALFEVMDEFAHADALIRMSDDLFPRSGVPAAQLAVNAIRQLV